MRSASTMSRNGSAPECGERWGTDVDQRVERRGSDEVDACAFACHGPSRRIGGLPLRCRLPGARFGARCLPCGANAYRVSHDRPVHCAAEVSVRTPWRENERNTLGHLRAARPLAPRALRLESPPASSGGGACRPRRAATGCATRFTASIAASVARLDRVSGGGWQRLGPVWCPLNSARDDAPDLLQLLGGQTTVDTRGAMHQELRADSVVARNERVRAPPPSRSREAHGLTVATPYRSPGHAMPASSAGVRQPDLVAFGPAAPGRQRVSDVFVTGR